MADARAPIEVFCSYAHEDEAQLQHLKAHLSPLQRQERITTWHDRHIVPGTNWAQAIDTHLNSASIILLLISPGFFVSDYCYGIEMKRAMERHQAGEARVIPIVLRAVDWHGAPFAQLQALPTNAKPILSWSSQDEAFADVAAGIRRAIEDLSLLPASLPHAALPAIWNIPSPRNAFFIGREDLLLRLRTQLQAGQATALSQPQAISGLGGIGKTQLAVEYAYQYHQEYQAVLWARADSQEALLSSYIAIADLLHLPELDAQDQAITVQAVKTWLHTHRHWLLILDNADELDLLPAFLPPALGGHLLLTTRAQATGHLARRIEVQTLPSEQGALFLLRRASLLAPDASLAQASPEDRELALQITQALGGLPLALDQAGAYLEATSYSLSEYLQMYQQHRAELLKERRALLPDHPEPVATTWSLSFARVEEKNPAAAELLQLCAFLAPDAIAEEIITRGAPRLGSVLAPVAADAYLLGQAMEVLRAYSLVGRNSVARTLSMHRLMQAVMQDALEPGRFHEWAERAVRAVREVFPSVNHATWADCERLLPHAQRCAELIAQEQMTFPEAASLLNQTAVYLHHRGRYREAEPLFQRALVIYEQERGPSHPNTATSLNNLAMLYQNQGKYAEAEPLFQRALAICEQERGPSHPNTATSLSNLAMLYRTQGKYEEAESLSQRALAICEQELGPSHPQTAGSLNNLAMLYKSQGKYEEAEPLYQHALAIREQELGPTHPDTATSLNNLAMLYQDQGKYAEAEPLFQRALAIREQELGPLHPSTIRVYKNYLALLHVLGKAEAAAELETRFHDQLHPPSIQPSGNS